MNILNFLEEFTSENLVNKTSSRKDALKAFGSLGKKAVLASIPLGLATSSKAYAFQDQNAATNALQLALTLEYLEAEFYMRALESGVLPAGGRAEAVYQQISKHETAHVEFLKAGLGDNSVESPQFDFTAGGAFDPFNKNGTGQEVAYAQLLALAQAFEDTGVRAYKGQAGNLMGTPFLTPALQIHSVEARHASEVRRLRAEVMNYDLDQNALGWITLDKRGPGMPEATDVVYAGEEQVTQAGVNLVETTEFDAVAVSQAFDEPITGQKATEIAGLFIVS